MTRRIADVCYMLTPIGVSGVTGAFIAQKIAPPLAYCGYAMAAATLACGLVLHRRADNETRDTVRARDERGDRYFDELQNLKQRQRYLLSSLVIVSLMIVGYGVHMRNVEEMLAPDEREQMLRDLIEDLHLTDARDITSAPPASDETPGDPLAGTWRGPGGAIVQFKKKADGYAVTASSPSSLTDTGTATFDGTNVLVRMTNAVVGEYRYELVLSGRTLSGTFKALNPALGQEMNLPIAFSR